MQSVPTFRQLLTLAERVEKREALREKYPDGKFCVSVIEGFRYIPTKEPYPKPFLLYFSPFIQNRIGEADYSSTVDRLCKETYKDE